MTDMTTVTDALVRDCDWPAMEHLVRILVAAILGGAIGLEREIRDKPAGLRTMTLICIGACVFTILSQLMGGSEHDSTRIAAQVVFVQWAQLEILELRGHQALTCQRQRHP